MDLNPMDLMNQMACAEEKFCDKLDAEGPVVIHGMKFDRSLIMRVMAEDYYADALDAYMISLGIDIEGA
jgi:hypothetical protein